MNRKQRRAGKRADDHLGGGPDANVKPALLASLFAEVTTRHQVGQLADAIDLYDRILELSPGLTVGHCNRGAALAGLGRLQEAEAAYRKAIALAPGFADAHSNLGDILRALGRIEESEQALRKAISLRPRFAEAFSNLGNTLKEQGRLKEAKAAFLTAIDLNPKFAQAYNNLGNVLMDLGRIGDAERALRRAISLKPKFAEALSNLGDALRELGRLSESETVCRQAIDSNPDHAEAHSNLGNALKDQGRLKEAETSYRRAIALKPNFAIAHNNLGATLKDLGRFAEARAAIEQSIRLEPRRTLHYLNLSDVEKFAVGNPHMQAMQDLARDIESLSVTQQLELHYALAKAYDDIGEHKDAFGHLSIGSALKRQQITYHEIKELLAFERTRETFDLELIGRFQGCGEPSAVPVFIVGMPRSGTTLVEQILASHPGVFGAGELPNFGGAMIDLSIGHAGAVPYADAAQNLCDGNIRRLGARYLSEVRGMASLASRVTDKMLLNIFHIGLIHLALPNASIIHVARDPLDTCMSCFSKLFAAGQKYTYDLGELGRYYRCYQLLMRHWDDVLPRGRILHVRYEEVVDDLEGQARKIVGHCGLAWDARCLAFHMTDRPVRTASVAQVRQPIYRSAIGRGRTYEPFLAPLLEELLAQGDAPMMHQ